MASFAVRKAGSSLRPLCRGHRPLPALMGGRSVRRAHIPVQLPYDTSSGLGKFMSEKTLKMVANDYQTGLLDRLNELVRGTPQENQGLATSLLAFAEDRSKAVEFNYASQALNNSFFLDHLKPPASEDLEKGEYGHEALLNGQPSLNSAISTQYGGLAQLKSTFGAAAAGMASSGWVWLVTDQKGNLAVVATYGAGTMLFRSRTQTGAVRVLGEPPQPEPKPKRQTAMDLSRHSHPSLFNSQQPSSPGSGAKLGQLFKTPRAGGSGSPPSRSISLIQDLMVSRTRGDRLPLSGRPLIPLLACSVHEHCWLQDHGIWGKEAYMSHFWEVVDWRKVGMTYESRTGGSSRY